jgi:RNase P subunit RPR2
MDYIIRRRIEGGERMKEVRFCGECEHLSPTESVQNRIKKNIGKVVHHRCKLLGQLLYHRDYHPEIIAICNQEPDDGC